MNTPEDMISVQEAAKRMGRSIEQVRRYLREGKLPGTRIGNQWFIRETAVTYSVVTHREEEAMMAGQGFRTIHGMTPQERWDFFERVARQREAIRQRWAAQGVQFDPVELIRDIREEES